MALVLADRVQETSTTTGTGTLTLAGAVAGFQSFSVIGNANTTYYCITEASTGAWEVGTGTYTSSGTTLSRATVYASSNAGSLVNFTSGALTVFCTYPASQSVTSSSLNSTFASPPALGSTTPNSVYSSDGINGCIPYFNSSKKITSYAYGPYYSNSTTNGIIGVYTISSSPWYTSTAGGYLGYLFGTGAATNFLGNAAGVGGFTLFTNVYDDSTNGYSYVATGNASYMTCNAGSYTFGIAASGTGGTAITGVVTGLGVYQTGIQTVGVLASSSIKSTSSSAGVGYQSGAGSTITQLTSKSTAVTLNTICGQITTTASALAASTSVSFTLTNSSIAATDVVIVNAANVGGSAPTINTYQISVDSVLAGSCRIHIRNVSAASASQALVLNFAVIKSVAA
jgi:hypothetical protein